MHRIPLSPAKIAGILIDDGQTVTLADLSACIGYGQIRMTGQGSILLMEEGEKVTGFAASGGMDVRPVSPESVFRLPDFLKTPVFDTCAVDDGIPVPIINVAELYADVMKAGGEAGRSLSLISARSPDISAAARIRLFSAAGELFAVPAEGIENNPARPGAVTPMPNMPPHVKGVAFLDGNLLPVIDLPLRIKRHNAAPESVMLRAVIGDQTFGLLIDSDIGMVPADIVAIKPVPMIASKPWLKRVVVRDGELIPLVDLAVALSPDSGAADEIPVWQRYAPDSRFPDVFFKHDADVVEFSLLGERHALPRQEVEEVITCRPWRELPDLPPIVLGVAEHNGEILPVVDLAMMFGRLSLVTPAWRMMLVRNGDFRALVVTETAFAERRLAPDIHRAVPIHLPHNLMYGCYPDAQAVRLILNVEAISVHFEKSLIQKFLPSLSHEMKMMSAQAGPAHDVEPAAALSTEGPELLAARDQASVHQRTDEPAQELDQHAVEEVIGPIGEQEAVAEAHAFTPGAELRVAVLAAEPEASAQDTPSSLDGWSEWNEDGPREQDHLAAADEATENGMAPESAEAGDRSPGGGEPSTGGEYDAAELNDLATASSFSENLLQDLADVSDIEFTESQEPVKEETAELPEPAAPLRHAASRQLSGESINAHGSAVASEKSRVEMAHAPAQKKPAGNDPGQEIPATAYSRAAPARERVKDRLEAKPVGASSKPGALRYRNERTAGAWKRGVAYSAAAAVLLAVLFFVWSFGNTGGENNGGKNVGGERPEAAAQPAKAEQARVQAEQSLMPGKAENAQIETPHPAEMPEARLELDIPKNTPVDADVYVVEKGDTLWSISEHYTGTPLNYPRIAGENRIADPDMIFPGQRIHLRK